MKKHIVPLIGTVYLPSFFFWLMVGISQPTLPLFLTGIGVNVALVGLILSSEALGAFLGTIPGNNLQSRMSIRNFMVLGFGIATAALILLSSTRSVPLIFAAWMFVGVGTALTELGSHQLLSHIDQAVRGRSVSVLGGIHRLSNALGPALGGYLANRFSFTVAFWAMVGLAALSIVMVLIFLPTSNATQAADLNAVKPTAADKNYRQQLRETFVDNRQVIVPAMSGLFLFQTLRRSRKVLIPLIAAQLIDLNVAQVGYVMSIISFVDMLFFLPAGIIMDRYGRKWAIVPSLIIQSLGFLLLPFAWSFASLAVFASVIGFGNGLSSGTMMTVGADLAPDHQRIPFLGIWRLGGMGGFFAAPNVVGVIAQLFTLSVTSNVITVIGLTAASIFALKVPETLQKPGATSV